MCDRTVENRAAGANWHYREGSPPCEPCRLAARSYWRTNNTTDKARPRLWRGYYRLSVDAYDTLLAAQYFRCAICREPFKDSRDTHIDHDHGCDHPGKGFKSCAACVRGILCRTCNHRLAAVEAPGWLDSALAYLDRKQVTA